MRRLQVALLFSSTWIALLLTTLLLVGCYRSTPFRPLEDGSLSLPKRVDHTSKKEIASLQKKLNSQGAVVITIGQDYLISLPTPALFPNHSPRLTWGSYGLLNTVACYLQHYRKVAITITSYTGRYVSVKREHALTLARSRAVANYLWSQGIDSRLMFVEGAGADKPISAITQGDDRSANSRVEITFRDAIV